jgi:hypothetical protein
MTPALRILLGRASSLPALIRAQFRGGIDGGWYDWTDLSTLAQASAGTTAVSAASDPIGYTADKSGNGKHLTQTVDASRPILGTLSSGVKAAVFNGSSQFLSSTALATVFSGTGKPWTVHIAFSQTAVGGGTLFGLGSSGSATPYLWMQATTSATLRAQLSFRSDAAAAVNTQLYSASKNAQVFSIVCNGTTADMWANGVKVCSAVAGSTAAITLDRFGLGALIRNTTGSYGAIKVSEMVVTASVQTDTDAKRIHDKMVAKHVEGFASQPVDVLIVTGQSNAEGRGTGGGAGTGWFGQGASLTALADPVGGALSGSAWPSYSNKLYELSGRKVVVVEAAAGGTALLAAAGASNWSSTGAQRALAVGLANDVITHLAGVATIGKVQLIWCQGEQDAVAYNGTTVSDTNYQAEMETLFAYFLANITGLDEILVSTLGAPNDGVGAANWTLIRAAQVAAIGNVAGSYAAFTGAANFVGAGKMTDNVHYDQTGLNEMGEALATYANGLL